MKQQVVACMIAVALLAIPTSGQMAAKVDKSAAAPERSAKLDVRIPQSIAYQGKLMDSAGRPVNDGKYVMIFTLNADSIGSSFWQETQTVETKGGLFNILLGSSVPISIDAIPQGGCYLGIRVLPSANEFHRQKIASVPFAFHADNSDKLQGKDIAALDTRYVKEAQAAGGDLTGTYPSPTIARKGAANGQVLKWSDTDTAWIAQADNFNPAGAGLNSGRIWVGDTSDQAAAVAVSGDASLNNAGVLTLGTSGVTVGTYGSATQVGRFKVDAKGRLTEASNVAISGVPPYGAAGGDLADSFPDPTVARLQGRPVDSAPPSSDQVLKWSGSAWTAHADSVNPTGAGLIAGRIWVGDASNQAAAVTVSGDASLNNLGALTLGSSGVTPGIYGSDTSVAQVRVDSAGRVTAAGNVAISGVPPGGRASGDLDGTYPGPTIAQKGAADGQVLKWSGSAWTARNDSTIPSGSATGDLTGTYPSPTIAQKGANNGQLLKWNGSAWTARNDSTIPSGDANGDLDGTYPDPTVDGLRGRAVSATAPNSGQVLKWSGSAWAPVTDSTSGTASGDLSGTYPGPTVAKLQTRAVSATAPNSGQVLKWNGSAWAPGNDSVGGSGGGGTVTSVSQATGVVCTPDPITSTGTVGFDQTYGDNRYVNEAQTAGGDLTSTYPNPRIANSAVTTAKIADNNVTLSKIEHDDTPGKAIIARGDLDPAWGYPAAVGDSGTPLAFIKTGTFTSNLPSIAANSVYQDTVIISGLLVGDRVFLSHPITGTNWTSIQGLGNCEVTAVDTLMFRVWNSSASSVNPFSNTWQYVWIRP